MPVYPPGNGVNVHPSYSSCSHARFIAPSSASCSSISAFGPSVVVSAAKPVGSVLFTGSLSAYSYRFSPPSSAKGSRVMNRPIVGLYMLLLRKRLSAVKCPVRQRRNAPERFGSGRASSFCSPRRRQFGRAFARGNPVTVEWVLWVVGDEQGSLGEGLFRIVEPAHPFEDPGTFGPDAGLQRSWQALPRVLFIRCRQWLRRGAGEEFFSDRPVQVNAALWLVRRCVAGGPGELGLRFGPFPFPLGLEPAMLASQRDTGRECGKLGRDGRRRGLRGCRQ